MDRSIAEKNLLLLLRVFAYSEPVSECKDCVITGGSVRPISQAA